MLCGKTLLAFAAAPLKPGRKDRKPGRGDGAEAKKEGCEGGADEESTEEESTEEESRLW